MGWLHKQAMLTDTHTVRWQRPDPSPPGVLCAVGVVQTGSVWSRPDLSCEWLAGCSSTGWGGHYLGENCLHIYIIMSRQDCLKSMLLFSTVFKIHSSHVGAVFLQLEVTAEDKFLSLSHPHIVNSVFTSLTSDTGLNLKWASISNIHCFLFAHLCCVNWLWLVLSAVNPNSTSSICFTVKYF